MIDEHKTKEQLINKLVEMRQRVAELEAADTERKRAEEALRESENQRRVFMETATDLMHTADRDGNITYANEAYARVLGYKSEELIGRNVRDLIHEDTFTTPGYSHDFEADKERLIREGKISFDVAWRHKDGHRVDGSVSVVAIYDQSGEFIGSHAIFHDITDRKRAEQEIKRRNEELAALNAIAAAVSQSLELKETLGAALKETLAVLNAEGGLIYLFDETSQTFAPAVHHGLSQDVLRELTGFKMGEGLSGRVAESGEPLVVADLAADSRNISPASVRAGWHAYAGVPINYKESALGVMTLASRQEGYFRPDHVGLLSHIGNQIGVAIENARLYEETRRRGLEQETVSRIAYALNTPDVRDAFPVLVEGLQDLTGCDVVNLIAMDEAGEQFIITVLESPFPIPGEGEVMPFSATAAAEDVEAGRPHLTADLSTETHFPFEQALYQAGLRSWVTLPLLVGGEVFGALNLGGSRTGLFQEDQLPVLRQIADAVALALQNSLTFLAEQERRHIAETLRQTSTVLSSTLELDEVLGLILQQLREVIPYDSASIQRLQEERLEIMACQGFEEPDKVVGLVFPLDPKFPNHRVITTKAPLAIEDVVQDYPHFKDEADTYESGRIRSWLGVPLMVKDEVIGMIAVDRAEARPYTAEESELAMAFANQAGIAIENARLFEEEKRRAIQLALINEVGEKAASILDSDRLMQEVTRSIQENFNYYNVAFFLLDEERHEVVMHAVAGGFEHIMPGQYRQSLDEGIIGFTARTGKSRLANDVSKDPYYVKGFLDEVLTKSELCVPIKLGDKIIGGLDMQSIRLNAFDQGDVVAIEAVVDRVAIAMENARLYEETQRHSERLAQTLTLSELLHRGLELEQVLDQIAQGTARLGFRRAVINVCQPEEDLVRAQAIAGLEGPDREALMGATYRWSDFQALMQERFQVSRSYLIRHGEVDWEEDFQGVVVTPSREDRGLGYWHPEDMLLVPLWGTHGQPVGLLSVDEPVDGLLPDLNTIQTLEAFANQAAIAIENARLFEETERLKTFNESVVQGVAEAILIEDAQGILTFANPAAEELLGYTREELIGRHWMAFVPEEQVEKVRRELAKRPRAILSRYETALLSREGPVIPVIVSARPLFEEGEFIGVLSAFTDIRERVRREREIEERRLYLEGVLGAAPDAIVTLDAHHRVVEWNAGAERMFGYSREEAVGRNIDHLVTSPDVFEEAVGFTQTAMSGREVPPTETVRYRKDGSPVDVIVAGSPIMVGDELIGTVVVYTDITERVRMEETLRALALLDELTGLYNRRGFFTLAEQQLKMADRTETKMLLLFADFDDLKRINDTFGHPEGDQALIEVANILTETFRESDIIGRIGGDEFVVLAIETAEASAEILAARLQENLEARNARGDLRYRLSLSVGLARYDPGHPCSIDELLARADRSMYEKKQDNGVIARRAVCAEAIP